MPETDPEMPLVSLAIGESPIVATAIHDGHAVRESLRPLLAISVADRLREEDPYTGDWTKIAATRIVAGRSRFELDLNRPRDQAIYLRPDQSWGLTVWKEEPPDELVSELLDDYDTFYALLSVVLERLVSRWGRVVVLDLHTYNHRREGPQCVPADPAGYPEVNVGTGTMDRDRWAPLVDGFISDLSRFEFCGRSLDVRENVCFQGGNMSRWIHNEFPGSVCSLAIEFKKFFMDEWTGTADERQLGAIRGALASTLPGLENQLRSTKR